MRLTVKKIILTGLCMAAVVASFAWQPPKMQCLKLMNNNTRIKMAWSNSSDCSHFRIYYFYINGVLCDSLTGYSGTSGSYTLCDYGTQEINNIPTASEYHCYIVAVDSNNVSCTSDTIHSFSLTVTPQAGNTMAFLQWESPTSSFDNSWGTTFNIYKKRGFEADFPADPIATVPNSQRSYTDTSDVCDNTLSYQVGITHKYMDGNIETQCPFMTTIGSVDHMVDSITPAPPVLDSVTVTADNEVMLGFHETEPNMMAFIIYYINPNGTIPLDTIYGQTFWTDPVIDPTFDSRLYRIATMDSCGNVSPMTNNQQGNMVLHLQSSDACHKTASLSWSAYANLVNGIDHYEVMLSGDDGQSWTLAGTSTNTSYTVGNLSFNQDYLVYVRVVNTGGSVTASTNRVNFEITSDESQDFTYLRSVSVIDNEYIRVRALTSGDTLPFVSITLQRSEDGVTFENFRTQSFIPGADNYTFYDSLANFSRRMYYYRTFVTNSCGSEAGFSNIAHNILLHGENNAQNNILTWYGYDGWDGGVSGYYILRKMESEELFNTVNDIPGGTTNNYSDDISAMYESGSKFLYYVEAQEDLNSYGFNETSLSNQIQLIQPPTIYVPNAFRPLGANNKVFKPVNSFVSNDGYKFSIYTRQGELIFVTTNPQEGWDGKVNGVLVPLNVYVWYMEYKMPDGTEMERTGTVTLVK